MFADDLHTLPWYFGALLFVGWALVIVALAFLVHRRLKARSQRRAELRDRGRDGAERPSRAVRDDRSLGPGTDLERW